MKRISGECNECGQCCGCETAPKRGSPFPRNWPSAVKSWNEESLDELVVFRFTGGHPDRSGISAAGIKAKGKIYRMIWVDGVGLVADTPPYGDQSSYIPQCPFLMEEKDGKYACGIKGTEFDEVRERFQCRSFDEYVPDVDWYRWKEDHPNCSYVAS